MPKINTDYGAQALDLNQLVDLHGGTGIVSGCSASVGTNAMEADVASGTARVNGTNYSISASTVLLDSANADYPRKDLVVVDNTGSVTKITGTAEEAKPAGSTRRNTRRPRPSDISGSDVAVIAEVWVGAGASDIVSGDISDRRLIPLVEGFLDVDGDGVAELQNAHADFQGGDARNVGALDAGEASITKFGQPTEYIVYNRDGSTRALNTTTQSEEFSGSDPGAVIQSAHDAITDGGDILIKSGEYLCDTFPTISSKGVRLVGEGLPWRTQGTTPNAFGTVLLASSNIASTDTLELSNQFTGMDQIVVDANNNVNDAITTSNSKDIVISRYGVENAINYNIKCNTNNTWFMGPSWNEYAGIAGLRIHSRVEDLWVSDTLFVTNTEHDIEIGANLFNAHVYDNNFQLTDAGIRDYGGNVLHEIKVENNIFTGIGRDTGNSLNTCIRIESDITGRITGNLADGEDKDFNLQTDKFVELAGTIDATGLYIEDEGIRRMQVATVVDNANQPYHLNGVEVRNSTGATAPDQGVRLIYRRDLSPPELQAIAASGAVSTLATF